MAAEATTAASAATDYSHYGRYDQHDGNSSDSEQETLTMASSSSPKLTAAMNMMTPKRNKRKNFKPRCSTTNASVSAEETTEPVAEYSNNNNLKNVSRRKTMSTRKLVVDSR